MRRVSVMLMLWLAGTSGVLAQQAAQGKIHFSGEIHKTSCSLASGAADGRHEVNFASVEASDIKDQSLPPLATVSQSFQLDVQCNAQAYISLTLTPQAYQSGAQGIKIEQGATGAQIMLKRTDGTEKVLDFSAGAISIDTPRQIAENTYSFDFQAYYALVPGVEPRTVAGQANTSLSFVINYQ